MPTQLIRKQFLLTKEENRQIEVEAKKEGLSVSNLTRKLHGLEPLGAGGSRPKSDKPSKSKKPKSS
ncbi:MAG TPA: hypothetical protein VF644_01265 [Pyrinomonadaceae bacterium]|jgi:hypothetical protein